MPIYEYRCNSCGHYLDVLQKLTDEPLTECPECSGRLRRLISAPAFRLKGAGWYETDFKSEKERRRNLADAGGEKPSESGASADGKSPASEKSAEKSAEKKAEKQTEAKTPSGDSPSSGKKAAKGSGTEAA
jgi:putative FmdB family regulatory protein